MFQLKKKEIKNENEKDKNEGKVKEVFFPKKLHHRCLIGS